VLDGGEWWALCPGLHTERLCRPYKASCPGFQYTLRGCVGHIKLHALASSTHWEAAWAIQSFMPWPPVHTERLHGLYKASCPGFQYTLRGCVCHTKLHALASSTHWEAAWALQSSMPWTPVHCGRYKTSYPELQYTVGLTKLHALASGTLRGCVGLTQLHALASSTHWEAAWALQSFMPWPPVHTERLHGPYKASCPGLQYTLRGCMGLTKLHALDSSTLWAFQSYIRGADKSLARPGRNQATAAEDFWVSCILFITIIGGISVLFIYIENKTSIKRNILTIKQNTSGSRSG